MNAFQKNRWDCFVYVRFGKTFQSLTINFLGSVRRDKSIKTDVITVRKVDMQKESKTLAVKEGLTTLQ